MIVEGISKANDAEVVEQKLHQALTVPFEIEGAEIDAEIGIGQEPVA